MTVFEFDGIKLNLKFDLGALFRMDEEVCDLSELFAMYRSGENPVRYKADTFIKTLKVAAILAEAGKTDPPVTYENLRDALNDAPGQVILLQGAIMKAVGDSMDTRVKKEGPRDLVLEQLDMESGKNA